MSSVASSSDWEYVAGLNDDNEEETKPNDGGGNQTVVVEVPGGVLPSDRDGNPSIGASGGEQASETSSQVAQVHTEAGGDLVKFIRRLCVKLFSAKGQVILYVDGIQSGNFRSLCDTRTRVLF